MNKWIFSAGVLSSLTFFVHVFAGGPEIHDTLLTLGSHFPSMLQAFISVMWHAVSVILAINSVALLVAAWKPYIQHVLVGFVLCQYIAFVGLFILLGLTRLDSVLQMPQWILFVVISSVALPGLLKSRTTTD